MGRIHVLPDSLINRIAAGEVVERPASVVKELVENSLDAGARSIEVRVLGGGKRLIRVADDGAGMDRDDALLAVERHATSKLRDAGDLEAIATLGFRGEALASIAAVSRFLLRTAAEDGAGTEVEINGGKIVSVREAGLPRGTSIEVARLFFNVPARRKFLRADSTEMSHVARLLTHCALGYPAVRFHVEHGERRLIHADPAAEASERIGQLYGRAFLDKLLPFERTSAGVTARGFAGRPADALTRRDGQHVFVNGRVVQDRVISHAILEAYGNTVPKGRYPSVFLFVEIDSALVDVNVHPRKTEVRFRASGQVHDLVRDALVGALSHQAVVPDLADLRPAALTPEPSGTARATLRYLELADRRERDPYLPRPPQWPSGSAERRPAGESAAGPTAVPGAPAPGRLTPLVQYRDSYIVAQDERGLVLVDQHAAHERVLFEQYLQAAERNEVETQKLLFPLTVELAPHEQLLVENEADEFRRLGFVIQPFGEGTVRIDAIPAVAGDADPERLLRELLGEASRAKAAASGLTDLRRRLITTAACKAAVKVNDPLNRESMQRLLDDLMATVSPSTCPHGRPLFFRLTLEEIERAFGRR